jgi:hypothetical protein
LLLLFPFELRFSGQMAFIYLFIYLHLIRDHYSNQTTCDDNYNYSTTLRATTAKLQQSIHRPQGRGRLGRSPS